MISTGQVFYLGAALLAGKPQIKVQGDWISVRAEVLALEFRVHANQRQHVVRAGRQAGEFVGVAPAHALHKTGMIGAAIGQRQLGQGVHI